MAAQRGRTAGFVMGPEHRTKIAKSKILNRLISCAEGEIEMTQVQATVALGLMKKVMPDLTSTELTGEGGGPIQTEDVGQGAAKLAAVLDAIARRTSGDPASG